MQNQKLAIDASDLHGRWNRLAQPYTRLWDDVYFDGAAARLEDLEGRAADLSQAGTSFPNKKGKMLRWQSYVEQQHRVHA